MLNGEWRWENAEYADADVGGVDGVQW
jgi:hypothetical protein